jgi:hypothetical protein
MTAPVPMPLRKLSEYKPMTEGKVVVKDVATPPKTAAKKKSRKRWLGSLSRSQPTEGHKSTFEI